MTTVAVAASVEEATGLIEALRDHEGEEHIVLVVVNLAAIPEVTAGPADDPRLDGLVRQLGGVIDLNAAIEPTHPRDLAGGAAAVSRARAEIVQAAGSDVSRVVAGPLAEAAASTLARALRAPRLVLDGDVLVAARADVSTDGGARSAWVERARLSRVGRLYASARNVGAALWFSARLRSSR